MNRPLLIISLFVIFLYCSTLPKESKKSLIKREKEPVEERVGSLDGGIDTETKDISPEVKDSVEEEYEEVNIDRNRLCAIIPLSGKYRIVGEEVKKGIELANDDPRYQRLNIDFIDSNNDIERIKERLEELIVEGRISGVIGPIRGEILKELSSVINRYALPVIALTPKKEILSLGETIFRLFHTPESEIETLLKAVPEVIKKVAIIYPESPYGREMAKLMQEKLTQLNKEIKSISYSFGTNNFKTIIEETVKFNPELIFIPSSTIDITLIIHGLAVEGLFSSIVPGQRQRGSKGVRYLLPTLSFKRKFIEENKKYLIGTIWTGVYYPPSPKEELSDLFYQRVMTAYSEEPDIYLIRGYDAVTIFREGLTKSPNTREELVKILFSLDNVATVGPFGGFTQEREPKIPLWLYMLNKDGEVVKIDL